MIGEIQEKTNPKYKKYGVNRGGQNKMEYSKEELEIIQIAVIKAINNVIYIGIEGSKYDNDLRIVLAKTRCNLECIEESENKYIKGE